MEKVSDEAHVAPEEMLQLVVGLQEERRQLMIANFTGNYVIFLV